MEGDNNYVVICGYFGGVWETCRTRAEEPRNERYGLDWLNDKPFTTLIIPGNYENYDRLSGIIDERLLNSWLYEKMHATEKEKLRRGYPRMFWNGGYVRELWPHVLMLELGVLMINGMKCFVYGGARCHDIQGGVLNPAEYSSENELTKPTKEPVRSVCCFALKAYPGGNRKNLEKNWKKSHGRLLLMWGGK